MASLPLTPSQIAAAIAAAPPSLVLGLSVRDERLRDRSRYALAEAIADYLDPPQPQNVDQLALAL